MKNKIAVITRLHYDADDPKFLDRVEMYKEHTLKSLLEQTDQDFDIWIWCEEWHDEIVKAIHPRVNIFHGNWVKRSDPELSNIKKYFIDYTHWDKIVGLPKYEVQVGLDSDDVLAPNTIAEIRKVAVGDKRTAISLQPLKIDVNTGKLWHMRSYKAHRVAPIFALYQPEALNDSFMFAYQASHMRLAAYCDNKVELPVGLAYMRIHDSNESTTMMENEDRPYEG